MDKNPLTERMEVMLKGLTLAELRVLKKRYAETPYGRLIEAEIEKKEGNTSEKDSR